MPKPKRHEFTLRLPLDLLAIIEDVRGQKSVNQQINDWLWSKATGDQADRIADALRPVLAKLSDDDRVLFTDRAISAVEVLANGLSRKRSR